ncbi:oxidoreductase [Sphingorhabdus lutea]|uniref:Oxidoreductase n=1 Tax=Sphingorhabdus lutea TaxID=1913578 RepID=A0A1L3JE69_9SPHN|nr:SDR family NAD(P)-dependent oxidoreductase [Sphingorhabdus lutea]APG63420.1 oxidoreductase [Sphingorhabdus lutea]
MTKTILITGATDGIGLETAKMIAPLGHNILLHGRNSARLSEIAKIISSINGAGKIKTYCADLSVLDEVKILAQKVKSDVTMLDVLINNAGLFNTPNPLTHDGYDARFIVNVVAPYLLTTSLLPIFNTASRVINLSSAAQAPVNIDGFLNKENFSHSDAYAQSKLALTMWSIEMAKELDTNGPIIIAVNPASFLGSKMVREAYGQSGHDLKIGADILTRAALSDAFANASGQYYDNDRKSFASPHPDALHSSKNKRVMEAIESLIK